MKYFDKFLKVLKTDRNTFCTYILTLISIYLVLDRIVEMLLMLFTGMSVSYWGPIMYTFAIACPIFAFLFSGSSKFAKSEKSKHKIFIRFCVSLYIIIVSMPIQWVNMAGWIGLLSVPNYPLIASEFSDLIKPAFSSITIFLPLVTAFPLFKWLHIRIMDTKDIRDSINDYGGIDLSDKTIGVGPYTCEVAVCVDGETGSSVKIPEAKRYESMLVVGVSGSGKTSMIFEPMAAQDIEKKHFFKESAKEMGFTALKTGIATLNAPYDNKYLNLHFNLNMLTPNPSKIKIYKAFMKKMIHYQNGDLITYRNLGLTYMSPDPETINKMRDVADNFGIPVNVIDPNDSSSLGLNPFSFDDPIQTSVAISTVLKGLHATTNPDVQLAYRENIATQVVENLSILLKLIYPINNGGQLPNLHDLLKMLNDFSLVEKMTEQLKQDTELSKKYEIQIGYFEKNFYENSSGKKEMEKYVSAAAAQLDNLLRYPGVNNILCNRTTNLNYDNVLDDGDITVVCTRRGDLGENAHKAFGLFFLLLMQYSILRRPGNESSRIPHFLYIDEFPDFITPSTEPIFTLYRKYRIATVISAQNLSQLAPQGMQNPKRIRDTITSNCANKVVFGNNTPEDNDWWEKELGEKREWSWGNAYETDKGKYDPKYSSIEWKWKPNYKAGKVQALKFKKCIYKLKDLKGKNRVGAASVDYLPAKYKERQDVKEFNFAKFTSGIAEDESSKIKKKHSNTKINLKGDIHFDDNAITDIDPIQTDISDSSFLFNNDEAIIFDLNKNNKKTDNK